MIRNKEIRKLVIFLSAVGSAFTAVFLYISVVAAVVFIAAFAMICNAVYIFTRERYKKIYELSEDLNKISGGDFGLDVRDNEEGELSILRNEIYKLASKLSEQAASLEKEKNSLAGYLSDISHQLKTPLTSLLVMSELLEDKNLPPKKRDEFIGNIRIRLFRMEWLVLSLLKMARLDANAAGMQRSLCRVEEVVTLSSQALEIISAEKRQRVALIGNRDVTVMCDMNWTVEALCNVVKNALENSPENSEIKISWEENPLAVVITVEDEGSGINEKDLPNLFQRFYRGVGVSKENTGIGLALSLAIMRGQNGDITADNKKGQGAVFALKFYKDGAYMDGENSFRM